MRDGVFKHIDQLLVEIHMWQPGRKDEDSQGVSTIEGGASTVSRAQLARYTAVLGAIPMRLFHVEQNEFDAMNRVVDGVSRVYELGFVRA